MKTPAGLATTVLLCFLTLALQPRGLAQQPKGSDEFTLKVDVNAVLVPVVVRDAQGRAIGDLRQEDFKVLDQGKPRKLTGFSVEKSEAVEGAPAAGLPAPPAPTGAAPAKRFIVFLFDDRHLGHGDLGQAKKAGAHMLDETLADGDRAVVLSFMGVNSGVTHDRAVLQAAILKLKSQEVNKRDPSQCPSIDYL
jgi:VWFA-related protein